MRLKPKYSRQLDSAPRQSAVSPIHLTTCGTAHWLAKSWRSNIHSSLHHSLPVVPSADCLAMSPDPVPHIPELTSARAVKGDGGTTFVVPGQPTHQVLNQVTPLSGYNAFSSDVALVNGVTAHGGAWGEARLRQLGEAVGSEEWQARAAEAGEFSFP